MSKLLKTMGLIAGGGILVSPFLLKTKNESIWKNITMPVISKLDAETAHRFAVKAAAWKLVPNYITDVNDQEVLKSSLWGLEFESPLGLAAGFDKHAECIDGMLKMGFAFVEVGSITPLPQEGNKKPRVFRLKEDAGIINRYGFNSFGVDYAYNNLKLRNSNEGKSPGVVAVNIGKNKTTEKAAEDYVKGVMKLGEFADYLVINVSSPNTPGLRRMQGRQQLQDLIKEVLKARKTLSRQPPILVKIAPDLKAEEKEDIASVVLDPSTKVDGLIISNTTISRDNLQNKNKQEQGGLSGQPLKSLSTQCIHDMYKLTEGKLPIIGAGGIASGEDAYEKICNGASLVQLYSSLALNGPPVVGKVKRELAELLRKDGFSSITEAVGCDTVEFHCPTPEDYKDAGVKTK
ncbi:dihydroorotate dehydrogenase (quinone), mitochondrial-like [Hydractinia symbiolongicarpus]|uniref:dihydroorotate dehydrogenase (quinone), mitochondrial-like n=1 Tax=Hydractinia symbiolongicarpus TaxID=13093 RepID=UPI0025512E1C|nr:dihydroorotate dehydrogenase (quinone), mitochondrial-like [Hydractinia symbiolongicarpus]